MKPFLTLSRPFGEIAYDNLDELMRDYQMSINAREQCTIDIRFGNTIIIWCESLAGTKNKIQLRRMIDALARCDVPAAKPVSRIILPN